MENQTDTLSTEILTLIETAIKDKNPSSRDILLIVKACKEKHSDFSTLIIERLKTKKISYVRHAESGYNAFKAKSLINRLTPYKNTVENYDPSITEKGQQQCQNLVDVLNKQELEKVDVIMVSPFRRAIETFLAIKEAKMINECSNIILTCLLRERLDTPCDIGTPLSMLQELFTEINYEFMGKENWWSHEEKYDKNNRHEPNFIKEKKEKVKDRIALLLIWIALRNEKNFLLVGHSNYYTSLASKTRWIEPNIKNAEMKVIEVEEFLPVLKKFI